VRVGLGLNGWRNLLEFCLHSNGSFIIMAKNIIRSFIIIGFLAGCAQNQQRTDQTPETFNNKWKGTLVAFCRDNDCKKLSEPAVQWSHLELEDPGVALIPNLTLSVTMGIMDSISEEYRKIDGIVLAADYDLSSKIALCNFNRRYTYSEMLVSRDLLVSPNPVVYGACLIDAVQSGILGDISNCNELHTIWRRSDAHLKIFVESLEAYVVDETLEAEMKEAYNYYSDFFEKKAVINVSRCLDTYRKV